MVRVYRKFVKEHVITQWFLMIKRIIEEKIRGIDVYELRYNERYLEIFEKILKKYKQEQKNQLLEQLQKMKEIGYRRISLARTTIRKETVRKDLKVMDKLEELLL